MKHLLSAVGILFLLASPLSAGAASSASSSSAPSTLYTRIKQQVEKETSKDAYDDDVITFLRLTFKDKWDMTDDQIRDVLRGNGEKACGDADSDSELRKSISICQEMNETVQKVATQEQNIRTLGRKLTTLIAGYELPLSDLPDQTLRLSTDLLGILNIWSAGTGSILSTSKAPVIRTVNIESSVLLPRLQALANALKKLDSEQLTAIVWRYKHGVLLNTGRREPEFPKPVLPDTSTAGTERQYLSKNWIPVEDELRRLWEVARTTTFDPLIAANEIAYVRFTWAGLPDNILVWIRVSGDGGMPFGDAGLDWKIPLVPVLPSLKKDDIDEAIPGGNFPPEPVVDVRGKKEPWNGMQLCSNPFARRGYLCRPFEELTSKERCPVEVPADSDAISLVHCTVSADPTESTLSWCVTDDTCKPLTDIGACYPAGYECGTLKNCQRTTGCTPTPTPAEPTWCCLKNAGNMCAVTTSSSECVQRGGSPSVDENGCVLNGCSAPVKPDVRYTTASADVCRDIGWKNTEPFDPNTQCKPTLRCAAQCSPGSVLGTTFTKQADGTIDVCINEKGKKDIPASYTAFHQLAHAYQFCGNPPTDDVYAPTPDNSSEKEKKRIYDENAELCCRMEGEAYRLQCDMMERDGLFDNASSGSIPINGATCAEASTDTACKNTELEVDGKKIRLPGCFTGRMYPPSFMTALEGKMKTNPKNLAASCADAIDPKKMDPRVKALKEEVERRDDVCTPAIETDYSNRIGNNLCYIGQCAEQSLELHRLTAGQSPSGVQSGVSPWQDPQTGTPLGNLLTNPPLAQYRFPPYRPELLARTLDSALCQSVGLPPLLPPSLCAVEASRQLQLTRGIGFESVAGLVAQGNQQQIELRDLLDLSRGIGIRTGTELYGNYLRESSRSFAEILGMASKLLRELDSISFPTEMCPIIPGLPAAPS